MRLAKVLKGRSKRSWAGMGRQEAIFQLHLLLNANFQYRSLKLIQDRDSHPATRNQPKYIAIA
jgi:hypothetical protein